MLRRLFSYHLRRSVHAITASGIRRPHMYALVGGLDGSRSSRAEGQEERNRATHRVGARAAQDVPDPCPPRAEGRMNWTSSSPYNARARSNVYACVCQVGAIQRSRAHACRLGPHSRRNICTHGQITHKSLVRITRNSRRATPINTILALLFMPSHAL
ncbi:hypothetical protein HYPSUDRAFT_363181 [Hypholoma sublateritium FD-334 SS-4]|uniref:Uncharacterized protein n=1 Tax=Hypholoma sublateritium (strain FD-334 SS-4) TaxID=945553 RepID=A0A0D2LXD4_HYPSF|nr:hypothetical protein HYPSUDRAFT_363181 [Hypholoma sublateritium FD-334 SS-4]